MPTETAVLMAAKGRRRGKHEIGTLWVGFLQNEVLEGPVRWFRR